MAEKNFWEKMQINDMLVIDTIRKFGRDTIYFKDRDSKFIWNNYMHANQLGVMKPEELVGKSDFDFFPQEFAERARQIELEVMATGKPVLNIEEALGRDITDQKKLELELERSYHKMELLARVDDLSGLYNRRYFYESLEKYTSLYERRTDGSTFALFVADVDDMTHINDIYGQQNGDTVLRSIADLIVSHVRKEDTCFRTGGDEFAILLLDTDKISAVGIAKKLVEKISTEPVILDGKRETVTVSAGLAVFDPTEPDISVLLSKAERKLNKSKREGKNKISF